MLESIGKLRALAVLGRMPGLLAAAGLLSDCGDIRIAGGASEVGNPNSAIYADKEPDTSDARVTGFGISATGTPIRVIREKRATGDSSATRAAPDSAHTP
jgi:hypothetical protein